MQSNVLQTSSVSIVSSSQSGPSPTQFLIIEYFPPPHFFEHTLFVTWQSCVLHTWLVWRSFGPSHGSFLHVLVCTQWPPPQDLEHLSNVHGFQFSDSDSQFDFVAFPKINSSPKSGIHKQKQSSQTEQLFSLLIPGFLRNYRWYKIVRAALVCHQSNQLKHFLSKRSKGFQYYHTPKKTFYRQVDLCPISNRFWLFQYFVSHCESPSNYDPPSLKENSSVVLSHGNSMEIDMQWGNDDLRYCNCHKF